MRVRTHRRLQSGTKRKKSHDKTVPARLLSIFLFSFGLAVACLGTEPRSLDRAVMLAGIQDAGAQWVAAEAQYPALTVVLFALYSNHPAFQSMLHDWGHNTPSR